MSLSRLPITKYNRLSSFAKIGVKGRFPGHYANRDVGSQGVVWTPIGRAQAASRVFLARPTSSVKDTKRGETDESRVSMFGTLAGRMAS
jgi:hypothetical protein